MEESQCEVPPHRLFFCLVELLEWTRNTLMPDSIPLIDDIQNYAQNIVDTVREPLLILDATLRVRSANRAFYQTFHVSSAETEERLIDEFGNGRSDIPDLRTLLEDIVPRSSVFDNFELEHTFPDIGRRVMLLTPPVLATHHSPLATPLKVLVVDDNVDTVLSFSMLLRASGHDVQTAHDGWKAVEAAIDYRPDIMLLDIGLPGLNGYEVAKQIRQHPDLQHVVLVALTGYGQDSDRQASGQAGFTHHLVKPARFDELQKILATAAEQVA